MYCSSAGDDDSDSDADLVDELFYGFEQGVSGLKSRNCYSSWCCQVDSAKRVVRVAQVAARALKRHGG